MVNEKIKPVQCMTVGDVLTALAKIPPGTPVESTFDEGVVVVFFNLSDDTAHVQFEANDGTWDATGSHDR